MTNTYTVTYTPRYGAHPVGTWRSTAWAWEAFVVDSEGRYLDEYGEVQKGSMIGFDGFGALTRWGAAHRARRAIRRRERRLRGMKRETVTKQITR